MLPPVKSPLLLCVLIHQTVTSLALIAELNEWTTGNGEDVFETFNNIMFKIVPIKTPSGAVFALTFASKIKDNYRVDWKAVKNRQNEKTPIYLDQCKDKLWCNSPGAPFKYIAVILQSIDSSSSLNKTFNIQQVLHSGYRVSGKRRFSTTIITLGSILIPALIVALCFTSYLLLCKERKQCKCIKYWKRKSSFTKEEESPLYSKSRPEVPELKSPEDAEAGSHQPSEIPEGGISMIDSNEWQLGLVQSASPSNVDTENLEDDTIPNAPGPSNSSEDPFSCACKCRVRGGGSENNQNLSQTRHVKSDISMECESPSVYSEDGRTSSEEKEMPMEHLSPTCQSPSSTSLIVNDFESSSGYSLAARARQTPTPVSNRHLLDTIHCYLVNLDDLKPVSIPVLVEECQTNDASVHTIHSIEYCCEPVSQSRLEYSETNSDSDAHSQSTEHSPLPDDYSPFNTSLDQHALCGVVSRAQADSDYLQSQVGFGELIECHCVNDKKDNMFSLKRTSNTSFTYRLCETDSGSED